MTNYPIGAENDPRSPFNEVEKSNCLFCNELTEKDFCNKECYTAYIND